MFNKYAFLIDMDGVVYRENQLIAGAREMVASFFERSIPFLFVTNNSMPTPEDLVVKMRHLGIPDLLPEHFYTSAMNAADFLSAMHPCATAFVVGEGGIVSALKDARIPNDSIRPTYVVVGEGTPTLEKLNKAHELIESGAKLVATNPDNWCPVSASKTRPGAGALAAYLEASTGQRAYYLGKPNPYMFSKACARLQKNRPSLRSRDVIMIGDTMETDIRGSIEVGMQAYLVLTGSTGLVDLANYVYQPTCVIESVQTIVDALKNGELAESISANQESIQRFHEKQNGNRHQTDRMLFTRRRPAMTK